MGRRYAGPSIESPIREEAERALRGGPGPGANLSLFFERYPPIWGADKDGLPKANTQALSRVVDAFQDATRHQIRALKGHTHRLEKTVKARGGISFVLETEWNLALGLGAGHPSENGLTLDPVFGVPVIPGSSLKGLCRAFLKATGQDKNDPEAKQLFGVEPPRRDPAAHSDDAPPAQERAGELVFLPAFPEGEWPRLTLDVVNCHLPGYYRKMAADERLTPGDAAPTDNPTPAFFLAVAPGVSFRFYLYSRARSPGLRARQVARGQAILQDALATLGIGGKTAAGYGAFAPLPGKDNVLLHLNGDDHKGRKGAMKAAGLRERDVESIAAFPTSAPAPTAGRGVGAGPLDWSALSQGVDAVVMRAQGVAGENTAIFAFGHAPLPLWALLGHRLGAWRRGVTLLNQRPSGDWDRITPEGEGSGVFFTERPRIDGSQDPGFLGVYVSLQGGDADIDSLDALATEVGGELLDVIQMTANAPLGAEEGPSAAQEILDMMGQLPSRYPKCEGLILLINGSAPLAYFVGRGVNPNLFKRILIPNFEEGRYVMAVDTSRA